MADRMPESVPSQPTTGRFQSDSKCVCNWQASRGADPIQQDARGARGSRGQTATFQPGVDDGQGRQIKPFAKPGQAAAPFGRPRSLGGTLRTHKRPFHQGQVAQATAAQKQNAAGLFAHQPTVEVPRRQPGDCRRRIAPSEVSTRGKVLDSHARLSSESIRAQSMAVPSAPVWIVPTAMRGSAEFMCEPLGIFRCSGRLGAACDPLGGDSGNAA